MTSFFYLITMMKIILIIIPILFLLSFAVTITIKYCNLLNTQEEIHKKNIDIDKENKKIALQSIEIKNENQRLIDRQKEEQNRLKELSDLVETTIKNQKKMSQDAMQNYFIILDKEYEKREKDFENKIEQIRQLTEEEKQNLQKSIAEEQFKLDSLKSTYKAAIEAQLKEKKIKEKSDFYRLKISEADLADVRMLEKIKPNLNKPRVLSMLIWSTFFQKQMNILCVNILGTQPVTGIYKITNLKTGQRYIGQAVDVALRWKQHAKCGLGIDTPQSNKLYIAMQEDGIWNFSWELLEECKATELNKKECEYIELYQSKDYGYNTQAGNQR